MKKFFRYALLSAMAMFSTAAMADTGTLVGLENNSLGYFGAFSKQLTLTEGKMATYEFTNHTDKVANSHSWIACVGAGDTFDAANPLVALRADNWENIQWGNTGISSNYSWDYDGQTNQQKFRDEQDGASVVVTFKYEKGAVTIHADMKTVSGATYFEEFTKTVTGNVTVCMSIENSHMYVTKAEVTDLPKGTLVGLEDNSLGYFGAFSTQLTLTEGKMATYEFTNHTDKVANSHSWIACVGAGDTFDAANPLVALRADNWENIQWGNTGIFSNYSWDYDGQTNQQKFRDEQDGASVVVTFKYEDGAVTIHADMKTVSGATYFEEFTKTVTGNVTVCMSIENSHMYVTKAEVTDIPEGTLVGLEDNSLGYFGAFSKKLTLTEGKMATYEFTNHTDKVANSHSWIACVGAGDTFNAANPLVALRADNWENIQWSSDNISSNYSWDYDGQTNQQKFRDEQDGASVVVTFKYENGAVTIHADMTATDEATYFEEFTKTVTGNVTVCMSIENSHMYVTKAEVSDIIPTAISAVKTVNNAKAVRYNMAGQQVGAGFKGIVIENGRKFLNK